MDMSPDDGTGFAARPGRDITVILQRWSADPSSALEELMPVVYGELRRIAAAYLAREYENQTLQPTALIHEAYLRLVKQDVATFTDRAHFYGLAARTMRQILVDAARARHAEKRDLAKKEALSGKLEIAGVGAPSDFLALHEALEKLAEFDSRGAQVIELRYFGGLQIEEIAAHLAISLATVKRDLSIGVAWLRQALG